MRALLTHFKKILIRLGDSRAWQVGLVATIAVGIMASTAGYAAASHEVTLSVDGKTKKIRTFSDDVRGLLQDEGIELGSRDVVVPTLGSSVSDGSAVAVRYSRPLSVNVDGEKKTYWTTATRVEVALDQLGIRVDGARLSTSRSASIDRSGMALAITTPKRIRVKIGNEKVRVLRIATPDVRSLLERLDVRVDSDDIVRPGLAKLIEGGETIRVVRVKAVKKRIARERVASPIVEKKDSSLASGTRVTVTEGSAGVRDVTYRLVFHNGRIVARTVLAQTVITAAKPTVVRVGTKVAPKPAPVYTSGSTVWDRLAECESGGNWAANTGNGYYGGLQFSLSTWRAYGGSGYPHENSREAQIAVAQRLFEAQGGFGAWPHCGANL